MNFDIKFDFQRRDRLGLIEAIWGQDKSIDQLERLCGNVLSKNEVVFITRINSEKANYLVDLYDCLLYTSPSPRDPNRSRMPSSA